MFGYNKVEPSELSLIVEVLFCKWSSFDMTVDNVVLWYTVLSHQGVYLESLKVWRVHPDHLAIMIAFKLT